MSAGELFVGHVMHRRLRPRMHHLRYRIFSLLLDLEKIDRLDRGLRFFSHGKFNFLSFHDRDHGDGSEVPLREQVAAHLQAAGVTKVGRVRLLAMPRVLGFVFNPLSVYFCDGPDGSPAAILYEVHNTFGERHTYVLKVDASGGTIRQEAAKQFHVSPFLPMALDYSFRVKPPGSELRIAIQVADSTGPILAAVHVARSRPLSDPSILRTLAVYPLMNVKVVASILWEALKLLVKGVSVHPRPKSSAAKAADCAHRQQQRAKAA